MHSLRLLFLLMPCLLLSCSSSPDTQEQPVTDHEVLAETADTAAEAATKASAVYSMPDSVALRNYQVDTTGLPPEPEVPIKILQEGLFHKTEVWQGAQQKLWMGLFDKQGSYELQPATVHITPAFDPVADARTEIETGRKVISGREVRGAEANVMLFITGLRNIKPGTIDTATFVGNIIRPGKELIITFKNKNYRLSAFGDSTQLESGEYAYHNYGWKISGTVKGKKREQVLAQDELFLNAIYMLHWAGDIDRDGIPDLVAELSNHYNTTRTALFLSSAAAKGDIYKKVAVFESTSR